MLLCSQMIQTNTMSIPEYLSQHSTDKVLTLVGPLRSDAAIGTALAEPVIFVDGGARSRLSGEGIAVGDGDSAECIMDIFLDPDKDFSDLAFTLNQIPVDFTTVHLSGFLGGRRDHELFNLGEVYRFLKARPGNGRATFDEKISGYAAGQWEIERHGGFSLAVLEDTRLTLTGNVRYSCAQPTRFGTLESLGLSNVGSGSIYIDCDAPVYVLLEEFQP